MPFPKDKPVQVVYEYDFAKDGGDIGSVTMRKFVNGFYNGLTIKGCQLVVETPVVSATGTLTIGDGTDVDGFFPDIVALPAGSYSNLSEVAGELLQDRVVADTEDVLVGEKFIKASSSTSCVATIATGAVTAGKFKVIFDCVQN